MDANEKHPQKKMSQKEYLKKYLNKNEKKKKKIKVAEKASKRVEIIDDDISLDDIQTETELMELYALSEDAPQIVAVVDERPTELQQLEKFRDDRWKAIATTDNDAEDLSPPRKRKSSPSAGTEKVLDENRSRRRRDDICQTADGDLSPPRKTNKLENSRSQGKPQERDSVGKEAKKRSSEERLSKTKCRRGESGSPDRHRGRSSKEKQKSHSSIRSRDIQGSQQRSSPDGNANSAKESSDLSKSSTLKRDCSETQDKTDDRKQKPLKDKDGEKWGSSKKEKDGSQSRRTGKVGGSLSPEKNKSRKERSSGSPSSPRKQHASRDYKDRRSKNESESRESTRRKRRSASPREKENRESPVDDFSRHGSPRRQQTDKFRNQQKFQESRYKRDHEKYRGDERRRELYGDNERRQPRYPQHTTSFNEQNSSSRYWSRLDGENRRGRFRFGCEDRRDRPRFPPENRGDRFRKDDRDHSRFARRYGRNYSRWNQGSWNDRSVRNRYSSQERWDDEFPRESEYVFGSPLNIEPSPEFFGRTSRSISRGRMDFSPQRRSYERWQSPRSDIDMEDIRRRFSPATILERYRSPSANGFEERHFSSFEDRLERASFRRNSFTRERGSPDPILDEVRGSRSRNSGRGQREYMFQEDERGYRKLRRSSSVRENGSPSRRRNGRSFSNFDASPVEDRFMRYPPHRRISRSISRTREYTSDKHFVASPSRDMDAKPPKIIEWQTVDNADSRGHSHRERSKRDDTAYFDRGDRQDSPSSRLSKMNRTLEGKKAGLQSAKDMREETAEFITNENRKFRELNSELVGRDAAPILRDRKTGRKRNLEEEEREKREKRELEDAHKEKYSTLGRGLKQVRDAQDKVASDLHEMRKPLARYADDDDLERILKEMERDGDPMLDYIRGKKHRSEEDKSARPKYKGLYPPNRFNMPPGYRWDGVDRSTGYEKKWFEKQSSRKARQEEAYKWSTADM